MKDKELREIVYELANLLNDKHIIYGAQLPPTNSESLMTKVQRLKNCKCSF